MYLLLNNKKIKNKRSTFWILNGMISSQNIYSPSFFPLLPRDNKNKK